VNTVRSSQTEPVEQIGFTAVKERGRIVLVDQGIDQKGETISVYDQDGTVLAAARNRVHNQDEVTVV
jgi:hypothetical protein